MNGHTCWICGSWVNFGEYHACGGSPTYPQWPQQNQTTVTIQPSPGEMRMAAALERIAVALERIAEPADSQKKEDAA